MEQYLSRKLTSVATTTATSVYTNALQNSYVKKIHVTNKTGTAKAFSLQVYDAAAAASYYLTYQSPIQANSSAIFDFDDGIPMKTSDRIDFTGSAVTSFDVMVICNEPMGRSG